MKPKPLLVFLPTAAGMAFLIFTLIAVTLKIGEGLGGSNQTSNLRAAASFDEVSLSLSPATRNSDFTPNTFYPTGIILDTAGKEVTAVDAIINFDPGKAYVDPKIATGTLLENFPVAVVDQKQGKITLSGINFQPRGGTGVLATFSFRPLLPGPVTFNFSFRPGEKLDSNVVDSEGESDILAKVEDAKYDFK